MAAPFEYHSHHAGKLRTAHAVRKGTTALLLALCAAHASAAYTPSFCQAVAGTLNIHWQAIDGPYAPCTGIECTDGTPADAADGAVTLTGTGVSDPTCIGTSAYTLTLSSDTMQLVGNDTTPQQVPMTLTRSPGEQCFVGTWAAGADVYEAYIWAGAFPLTVPATGVAVPSLGTAVLVLLAAMVGGLGGWFTRRRA